MILFLPTSRPEVVRETIEYIHSIYPEEEIIILNVKNKNNFDLNYIKGFIDYSEDFITSDFIPEELKKHNFSKVFSIQSFNSKMRYDNINKFVRVLGLKHYIVSEGFIICRYRSPKYFFNKYLKKYLLVIISMILYFSLLLIFLFIGIYYLIKKLIFSKKV